MSCGKGGCVCVCLEIVTANDFWGLRKLNHLNSLRDGGKPLFRKGVERGGGKGGMGRGEEGCAVALSGQQGASVSLFASGFKAQRLFVGGERCWAKWQIPAYTSGAVAKFSVVLTLALCSLSLSRARKEIYPNNCVSNSEDDISCSR